MDMNAMNNQIAEIQKIAALLDVVKDDRRRLDALVMSLECAVHKASMIIEDAPGRLAGYTFQKIGKDAVTIRVCAESHCDFPNNGYHVGRMISRMRDRLKSGELTGFRKNGQWYVTKDTLAENMRADIREDNRRRNNAQSAKLAA